MLPKVPNFRDSILNYHYTILKIEKLTRNLASDDLNDLEKMIIVLEDRRYLDHYGLDIRSLIRALWHALTGKKGGGGASTIEMQLIRTISGRYERTLRRKLSEIFQAILVQNKFSKIQLLRAYMKVAYLGTGIAGYDEATHRHLMDEKFEWSWEGYDSQLYSDISLEHAAQLASMLVYPRPRLPNSLWHSKIARRSQYGMKLYSRYEKSLKKLPR